MSEDNSVIDWRSRFRQASAEFGTVAGFYTVAELKDLIAAKDVEMNAMALQIVKGDAGIQSDFRALQDRYQKARATAIAAEGSMYSYITPDSLNVASGAADFAYKQIITALQQVPGVVSKGDKQDIANRLINKGWKPTYKVPQPKKGSDVDEVVYKGARKFDIIGPDGPKGPGEFFSNIFSLIPWWAWGVGGLIGVGFIISAVGPLAAPLVMLVQRGPKAPPPPPEEESKPVTPEFSKAKAGAS